MIYIRTRAITMATALQYIKDGKWECMYDIKSGTNEMRKCGTKRTVMVTIL